MILVEDWSLVALATLGFFGAITLIATLPPPGSGAVVMRLPRLWDRQWVLLATGSGGAAVAFGCSAALFPGALVPALLALSLVACLILGSTFRGNSIRETGVVHWRFGHVEWGDVRGVSSTQRTDGLDLLIVTALVPRPRDGTVLWFIPPHSDTCVVDLCFELDRDTIVAAETEIRARLAAL
jgi:hypothetical protein